MRKVYWVFLRGQQWDGPHFSERLADLACIRARNYGHGLVYVERVV